MRLKSFLITKLSRWVPSGRKLIPGESQCGHCDHFDNDPAMLEEYFQGVGALSSVRGCSRGDAGICRLHDRYLLPVHSCPDFVRKRKNK